MKSFSGIPESVCFMSYSEEQMAVNNRQNKMQLITGMRNGTLVRQLINLDTGALTDNG